MALAVLFETIKCVTVDGIEVPVVTEPPLEVSTPNTLVEEEEELEPEPEEVVGLKYGGTPAVSLTHGVGAAWAAVVIESELEEFGTQAKRPNSELFELGRLVDLSTARTIDPELVISDSTEQSSNRFNFDIQPPDKLLI